MIDMANLLLSEEETMLQDAARGFLDGAAPISAFRKLRDAGQAFDPGLWAEMAQMGWAGILVSEEAGGADMGHAAAGILAGEMGKTLAASPFLSTAVIAATALRDTGGEALIEIASGRRTYALAIDEGQKFAPLNIKTEARTEGNGYVLNGSKCFVVDGGFADNILVLARTGDGADDLTLFDLPKDTHGLDIASRPMVDARSAAAITLDDVAATGDHIVGSLNGAMDVLRPALMAGQAALAAEMTGLSAGAFAMTLGYLSERQQFGRLIGSFQALQHRAAHLWSQIEVTSSAILNAGRMLDSDADRAGLAVSLAKARAADTAKLAVIEGVQMHGGVGMTDAFDIGFYMKRARVSTEWLGDYSYHAEQVATYRGF